MPLLKNRILALTPIEPTVDELSTCCDRRTTDAAERVILHTVSIKSLGFVSIPLL